MSDLKTDKKFRYSRQREKILDVLKATDTHPTADWIYAKVKKSFPHISLGTVYRNLHQLAERKIIQEIFWGKEQVRFEYGSEEHPHFKCTRCNRLYHIEMPIKSVVAKGIEKNEGHKVEEVQLLSTGVCKNCLEKE